MKKSLGATLGLLCLSSLASAAPPSSQAYSIDQTRYFATPEIEQVELRQRIDEASAFPAAAPQIPRRFTTTCSARICCMRSCNGTVSISIYDLPETWTIRRTPMRAAGRTMRVGS